MTSIKIPNEFPSLKDAVAIITGASSGIGLATAQLFLANGARVAILDVKSPPSSLEPSPHWDFYQTDVTSWSSQLAAFTDIFAKYGHVDAVVANAGVGEVEDIFLDQLDSQGLPLEPTWTVIDINLKGALSTVKLAVHFFKKNLAPRKGGRIIMTGSTASYLTEPIPAYQAAKHGLLGLMRATRASAPKFNISINLVAPWMTESTLMTQELRSLLEKNQIPINEANSVARAIAFLSEEGGWNGKTILVAGNQFAELEDAIDKLRPQWLGSQFDEFWRKGESIEYFTKESGW